MVVVIKKNKREEKMKGERKTRARSDREY